MTGQIIRGSCRHALGKILQTVVCLSCVKIVSLLLKLQLLRAKEISHTEQVGQTQQFSCRLARHTAGVQQSAACRPSVSRGWPTGLRVGEMGHPIPCALSKPWPPFWDAHLTDPSLFVSSFLSSNFHSFYTLLFLPCVTSTAANSFSWAFLSS